MWCVLPPWLHTQSTDTPVVSEAPHGGEMAAAGRAAEWFLPSVNQLVYLQVAVLAELPPADTALKRLLTAVHTFMSDEILRHVEAPPTDLADKRLFTAVRALVQLHSGPC